MQKNHEMSRRPGRPDAEGSVNCKLIDESNASGTRVTHYRIDVNLPFYGRSEEGNVPRLVHRGRFELRCSSWSDWPELEVRPAEGSPLPYHPYFDPRSGQWNPSRRGDRTRNPESYIWDFVKDLRYGFAPTRLEDSRVKDREAAKWYKNQVQSNPIFFKRLSLSRTEVADSRLRLFPKGSSRRLQLLTAGSGRLELLESDPGYQVEEGHVPVGLSQEQGVSSLSAGTSRYHLYISGSASQALFDHIGWGTNTAENAVEQGGWLLGRVFRDRDRKLIWGSVHRVVPAELARGSSTHLHFPSEAWKAMLDCLDDLEDRSTNSARVIGWYHTHPGALDVFMSGIDRETQGQLFREPWHFSVVLNPQREQFKVYHGADSEECRGDILHPNLSGVLPRPPKSSSHSPFPNGNPGHPRGETPNEARAADVSSEPLLGRVVEGLKVWQTWAKIFAVIVPLAAAVLITSQWYFKAEKRNGPEPLPVHSPLVAVPRVQNEIGQQQMAEPKAQNPEQAMAHLKPMDADRTGNRVLIRVGTILRVISATDDGWFKVEIYRNARLEPLKERTVSADNEQEAPPNTGEERSKAP